MSACPKCNEAVRNTFDTKSKVMKINRCSSVITPRTDIVYISRRVATSLGRRARARHKSHGTDDKHYQIQDVRCEESAIVPTRVAVFSMEQQLQLHGLHV